MNAAHKGFLQAFMSKSVQNAKEVRDLYKHCCEMYNEPYSDEERERNLQMVQFIRNINDHIQPFHLEVKKGICEDNGANFYCLVNNVENSFTRLASDYTTNELEFFKKLVENIVENEGCVGSRAALNTVERLEKRMMRQDAEFLLERFQADHWILQKEGMVSLSVRSILELNQYIQQVYPDYVKTCNMCNLICLKGQACQECGVKLHQHCATRYFSGTDTPRCPDRDCGAAWPRPVLVEASNRQTAHRDPSSAERPTRRRRQED